ncbi:helix-turn-helix domain-containing protein [Chitinophaga japonensis]|uniref:AraC-like DNA-binding protein n=1 Tax=Chitinophaga japonensis TaxID=104662 RepID=A0A562T1A5_CHIJA|nr:AraC family transcriptional regulator [Chitinophaga japonensis]TWI86954.1 AraC-like DNA-binding protein [Chitinophaga japonensis]
MTFAGIFSTLMLLGTLQGFIISGMLFITKKRPRPNRLLGVLILLISLCCLNLYLYEAPWFNANPLLPFILNFIPLILAMPLGPLLYFYVQASLDPDFRLSRRHRRHFYPVIIDIVPQLTAVVYIAGLLAGFNWNDARPWGKFIDDYNVYADIPRWLSLTSYTWLSSRYLAALKDVNAQHRKWMRHFIHLFLAFQVIWFIYLVPYVIPPLTDKVLDTVDWYPVYIPLVILIYCLGIKGYMMAPPEETAARKAAPSPPPAGVIAEAMPLLIKAMEEDRLYLDPALNLAQLAQHTGLAQKTISAVLNQHLQKSFNEFVNGYRIEAFKQKLQHRDQDHLTILGLALESGFNSQATFQRAFRNSTGMSPREYMQLQKTG